MSKLAWAEIDWYSFTEMLCVAPDGASGFINGRIYKIYNTYGGKVQVWNDCQNFVEAPKKWFIKV